MKQRRLPTLEELKQHVVDLCAAFNVKLVLVADLAQRPERAVSHQLIAKKGGETLAMLVECAPIVDESTYAVALHEIGHCVAPNGHFIGITEDLSDAPHRRRSCMGVGEVGSARLDTDHGAEYAHGSWDV